MILLFLLLCILKYLDSGLFEAGFNGPSSRLAFKHFYKNEWNKFIIYCIKTPGGKYHLSAYMNKSLDIDYITGYSEQKDFRKCIEARFPTIKVYYTLDDLFSDFHCTNDSSGNYFPTYYFESYRNTIYCKTIEEAATKASQITGSNVAPSAEEISNALDEYYQGYYGDDRYSLKEYEVRDD